MALTPIQQVRVSIGDLESSPYYLMIGHTIFTDEEIQFFLDINGGDLGSAIRSAAIAASFQIAGIPTREKTGAIEVWNTFSTSYLKTLDYIITTPIAQIPVGIIPWAGGISKADVYANDSNCDVIQSPLINLIQDCDITYESCCGYS